MTEKTNEEIENELEEETRERITEPDMEESAEEIIDEADKEIYESEVNQQDKREAESFYEQEISTDNNFNPYEEEIDDQGSTAVILEEEGLKEDQSEFEGEDESEFAAEKRFKRSETKKEKTKEGALSKDTLKRLNITKTNFKKIKFKKPNFNSKSNGNKAAPVLKFRFNGIKAKLILYFSLVILAATSTIGIVANLRAKEALLEEGKGSILSTSYEGAKYTQVRVESQKKLLESIAGISEIETMDWDTQRPVLTEQLKNTEFQDMAIMDMDGYARYTEGITSQLGTRDYVLEALKGETAISDLQYTGGSKELSIMIATPIKNGASTVGLLVGKTDGEILSRISSDTGSDQDGYAYIVNSHGAIVGHVDDQLVSDRFNPILLSEKDDKLKTLASFIEKTQGRERGNGQYKFKGKSFYAAYSPILNTPWSFVFATDEAAFLAPTKKMRSHIINIIVISLIVGTTLVYFIGRHIANPILDAIASSKDLSQLDVRSDIPDRLLKRDDQIGDLAKAFKNIIDNLRTIINEMKASSHMVTISSEEMAHTSEEASKASEEVTKVIEEIAKGAAEQALNTEEGAEKAELLGSVLEENIESINILNDASKETIEVVKKGLAEIDKLQLISKESSQSIDEIHDIVIETNNRSKKIGEVSKMIGAIAKQTDLLALNAAIEAARAGDAGRGFAVVAEEVRKLAEESAASTLEIDKIVRELSDKSDQAVKSMDKVADITQEQSGLIVSNKTQYENISHAMEKTFKAVEVLNLSGRNMEERKVEILDILQNLTAIAEENSASTQESAASMEELTASLSEIANSSRGLETLTENLETIIKKFKI